MREDLGWKVEMQEVIGSQDTDKDTDTIGKSKRTLTVGKTNSNVEYVRKQTESENLQQLLY